MYSKGSAKTRSRWSARHSRSIARASHEPFAGSHSNPQQVLEKRFPVDTDEMVLVRDIELYSVCEHHLLPFHGVAHVGYIPSHGAVVGLSKLARLVDVYARRPQVQERLTQQIADALMEYADARGVIVVTECEHLCMSMRGVKKSQARTTTSAVRGIMKDPTTRASDCLIFSQQNTERRQHMDQALQALHDAPNTMVMGVLTSPKIHSRTEASGLIPRPPRARPWLRWGADQHTAQNYPSRAKRVSEQDELNRKLGGSCVRRRRAVVHRHHPRQCGSSGFEARRSTPMCRGRLIHRFRRSPNTTVCISPQYRRGWLRLAARPDADTRVRGRCMHDVREELLGQVDDVLGRSQARTDHHDPGWGSAERGA